MLNFKNIRLIYFIFFTCFLLVQLWTYVSFWWLILFSALIVGIIIYGAFSVQSGFFIPTLNGADISEKKIALTFDDGPHPTVTPLLLELLAKHQLKACFFCIGKNIETYPDLFKKIFESGHIVANHTYTHDTFIDLFSVSKIKNELTRTHHIIRDIIQKKVSLFRPPYGITNPNISEAVRQMNYTTIGWNVRSLDTVIQDNDKIFRRIIHRIKPGAVILMHDTDKKVLDVVQKIINHASENGITIVPLDELLQVKAYE